MSSSLLSFDRALFLAINSLHVEWLNPVMVFFSGQFIWTPLLVFPFWAAWRKKSPNGFLLFGLFLLLALAASDVTSSYILKNVVNRFRPCREIDLYPLIYQFGQKCGGRFGFVSSHAANSFALAIFSICTFKQSNQWWHLLWILPLIISASRIYLGVHYPGDILGGSIVGIFWGSFFAWVLKNTKVPV